MSVASADGYIQLDKYGYSDTAGYSKIQRDTGYSGSLYCKIARCSYRYRYRDTVVGFQGYGEIQGRGLPKIHARGGLGTGSDGRRVADSAGGGGARGSGRWYVGTGSDGRRVTDSRRGGVGTGSDGRRVADSAGGGGAGSSDGGSSSSS